MMSDTKPPDIGHWLVATIAMWSDSSVKQDCIEMLVKTVKYDDLEDARSVISGHQEKFPIMKIPAVQSGEAVTLATRLFDKIVDLKNMEVGLFVPFTQLHLVPGVKKTGGSAESEAAISARMSRVELQQESILDMLKDIKNQNQRAVQQPAPALQVNGAPAAGSSFGPALERTRAQQQHGDRSRSNSTSKRLRMEMEGGASGTAPGATGGGGGNNDGNSYRDVTRRRRPRQGVQGTSKVVIKEAAAIAPVEFHIGNTHVDSDADTVKRVLKLVASALPAEMALDGELEVEVVECLTKEKEGYKPWCKNWRVRVPQKHKQHMMRPEALPEGWTSRRFFPARPPRPPPPPAHGLPTAAQVAVVTAAAAGQPAAGQPGHLPPGANYKQ